MSSLTAYAALKAWLVANWSATPLKFENDPDPYPPPGVNGAVQAFVYMATSGDLFEQLSIGAGTPDDNLWREEGTIVLACCVPTGDGVSTARGMAQTLADMMKGLALAPGLQCTDMRIAPGGPHRDDGNYWAVPLITSWYRNEPAT